MINLDSLTSEIRSKSKVHYLDSAAMSLIPTEVLNTINNFNLNRRTFGPNFTKYWDKTEFLREQLSNKICCTNSEIMFTLNTSKRNNLIANANHFNSGDNIVISDMEFPSNIYPWLNLKQKNMLTKMVQNKNGTLDIQNIINTCDEKTKAISLSWVQATNGYVIDLKKLGDFCHDNNIYLIIDAIQGLGTIPLDLRTLKIDFLVSGFFKWLLGPDGLAFVYIKKELLNNLNTPYAGWASMKDKFNYTTYKYDLSDSASRFETGNLNFSAIYGASTALKLTLGLELEIYHKITNLKSYLINELSSFPKINIKSTIQDTSSSILLFDLINSKKIHQSLKDNNIITNYRDGIRVSIHFYNTFKDLDKLLTIVKKNI